MKRKSISDSPSVNKSLRSEVQLAQANVSTANAVLDSSNPIQTQCLQFTIMMILDDTPSQQKLPK